MKKCTNCNEVKDLDDFYNMTRAKDGKQMMCITCYKQYFKDWRRMRNERPQELFPQSKVCYTCRVEKPISQFGKRSASRDKHLDHCRPCWRLKTNEAVLKTKRKYAKKQIHNSSK